MIKALLIDFARVLIFPVDKSYKGGINDLYKKLKENEDFNFFDNFVLNREFIDYLKEIKENIPVYMFTSDVIQKDPAVQSELSQIFINMFSASEMGTAKNDLASYTRIAKELNLLPGEILFIDDSAENIQAAQAAGVNVIRYENNSIFDEIGRLIAT